jgi:Xaa-Pro dipeptidase
MGSTPTTAPTVSDIPHVNGFPRYSSGEMERRHAALERWMEDQDLHAVVIGGATAILETSVQFFTNWPPLVESYVVFAADEDPVLFVRLWNHIPDAERCSVVEDVRYGGDTPDEQGHTVAAHLKKIGCENKRVGLIGPIRRADSQIFSGDVAGLEQVDLNADYRALRLLKSEEELHWTRVAAAFNDRAVEEMERRIKPGINEREIAQMVEDVYLSQGAVNLIHFTLSTPMGDPSICVPHQYHPSRIIESGDVVVTEISTTFWGYSGQILRSFTVDAEPTPLYQEMHDVAQSIYENILGVLRPGVTIGEILDQADGVEEAGFSIWDDLVHGFGGAYLPPILRTRKTRGATHPEDYEYQAGTVLVVQPNITTTDYKAGVQVGNCIHIGESGNEVLQNYPIKFIRCEA